MIVGVVLHHHHLLGDVGQMADAESAWCLPWQYLSDVACGRVVGLMTPARVREGGCLEALASLLLRSLVKRVFALMCRC